eukprot:g25304.t1
MSSNLIDFVTPFEMSRCPDCRLWSTFKNDRCMNPKCGAEHVFDKSWDTVASWDKGWIHPVELAQQSQEQDKSS